LSRQYGKCPVNEPPCASISCVRTKTYAIRRPPHLRLKRFTVWRRMSAHRHAQHRLDGDTGG
jgi:hypothetical protein